jgi:hypothetical protein
MKYPYIDVLPLIAEVQSDLKLITKTSSFTDEDCYIWGIDALREIGGNNYDSEETDLEISKYSAVLPPNFYLLEDITLIKVAEGEFAAPYFKSTVLAPADAATRRLCKPSACHPKPKKASLTYTLKVPPGLARFSFSKGTVHIKFLCLKTNERGEIMIQDEINGIQAVKNYIKMMLLQERWIMKEVNDNVYQTFKREWENYLSTAQNKQKFRDMADTKHMAIEQDQRFRRFNYKRR